MKVSRMLLAGLLMLYASSVHAQQLTFIPATGDYQIDFVDLDGTPHSFVVEAANKSVMTADVEVVAAGEAFEYRYTIVNDGGASGALASWSVPCPPATEVVGVTAPTGWSGWVDREAGAWRCSFVSVEEGAEVLPGESLEGFAITTEWLPEPSNGAAWSDFSVAVVPSEEGATPEEVYALIESVQGFDPMSGAPSLHPRLTPTRNPLDLGDPDGGFAILHGSLEAACGELGWISNAGICNSLESKLDAVASSLASGDMSAASGAKGAFSNELDALGVRFITTEGYWTLKLLADGFAAVLASG